MVEQRTENPRVPSSILGLGTMKPAGGSSSVVECLLAKEEVAGSNPVFRSISFFRDSTSLSSVILAKARIYINSPLTPLDSSFRWNDNTYSKNSAFCFFSLGSGFSSA